MIVVASCPHSGSHFVVDLLGYPLRSEARGNERCQNLYHVYPGESLEIIKRHVDAGDTLVSPMRHPMAVAQSWANRGKPIAEHPVHQPMIELFRNLIDIVDKWGVTYLPLDVPDRDRWLKRLGERIGAELKTDWRPKSHHDIRPATLHHDDIAAVDELLTDPFFGQFGYTQEIGYGHQETTRETAGAAA